MNIAAPRLCVFAAALIAAACHEELGIGQPTKGLIEVDSLVLVGVEAVDKSGLRDALATQETSWLPWGKNHYFDRDAFEQDLKRIEAFYDDQGYPDAEVASYDIDLDEKNHDVRLRVTISEGEPLIVAQVRLEDFDVLRQEVRDRLRRDLPLQAGEPLALQEAIASGELAAQMLKNHGYPNAEVKLDRVMQDGRVAVVLRAHPGPLSFFGPINIAGNVSVDDDVIRRQLVIRPGELFRRHAVQESLRQLYALELFEFANIELADGNADSTVVENEVPTRVTVTEGDHQKLEFSLGYGTEEKVRAEAEWRHVNFYGGARTLGLHAKWSWLDRGVEGTFIQPYLFSPNLSFSLQGQAWYADEPAFRALTRGGRATVTRTLGSGSTVSGAVIYQFQSSRIANEALLDPTLRDELIALGLDPTSGVQDGAVLALGGNVQWLKVNDRVNPTRGYTASLNLEQAGGWLPSTYNYLSSVGELRGYYTPHDRITVAARARFGSNESFGPPSEVPFFKRFFLGGASSLRGWGRYEVSSLSGFGLPIGGNSLFESSLEVRTRVWGNVGLVAFVDAGNVWSDSWDVHLGDLLYDAGPGLRYQTPIGPLRLDFAYQLNRLEGLRIEGKLQERPWRIHFSIGHAF